MFVIILFASSIECKIYQFEQGYAEVWYRIPVRDIFSLPTEGDALYNTYTYYIAIYSEENNDTVIREGVKGIRKSIGAGDGYVIDYFPIFLYTGHFNYTLTISLWGERLTKVGRIVAISDTTSFYASDLILGLKSDRDTLFSRRGIKYKPVIDCEYANYDMLFSYLEIYGLIPDSLFYYVNYVIIDSLHQITYNTQYKRLKYDYVQPDTHSINLSNYRKGSYKLIVEIYEPALDLSIKRESNFSIKEILPEIVDKPYAWEIKYLVSDKEYKKFLKMGYNQQIQYLKKFWSKRNYKEFEKRLLEADVKFSTSFIKGRDTPMGRYYIINGAPDEVCFEDMRSSSKYDIYVGGANYARPRIAWVYETKGIVVIFEDNDGDNVYELIAQNKLMNESLKQIENKDELKGYLYRDD